MDLNFYALHADKLGPGLKKDFQALKSEMEKHKARRARLEALQEEIESVPTQAGALSLDDEKGQAALAARLGKLESEAKVLAVVVENSARQLEKQVADFSAAADRQAAELTAKLEAAARAEFLEGAGAVLGTLRSLRDALGKIDTQGINPGAEAKSFAIFTAGLERILAAKLGEPQGAWHMDTSQENILKQMGYKRAGEIFNNLNWKGTNGGMPSAFLFALSEILNDPKCFDQLEVKK